MSAPAVATWRQGQWRVYVTEPGGREWVYDVIGDTDRPSRAWLAGTPWAIFPGGDWEEADGTAEPAVWTAQVYPATAKAALDLGIDWPPPQSDGKVARELQARTGTVTRLSPRCARYISATAASTASPERDLGRFVPE